MKRTVPDSGTVRGIYIFITSISAKVWLDSTWSPSSTTNRANFPGEGAERRRNQFQYLTEKKAKGENAKQSQLKAKTEIPLILVGSFSFSRIQVLPSTRRRVEVTSS